MYGYDSATGATTQIDDTSLVSGVTHTLLNSQYTYDLSGNVTKIAATADTPASMTDTQCFSYDYLQNLTQAWTPTDSNCTEAPSSSNIGGAAPYWTSYNVDPATGNRLSTTENATTTGGASTTDTYAYPAAGAANPHAVQTVTHVTGTTTTVDTYGYDADGDATSIPSQTLGYDVTGKVTSDTNGSATQSDVYNAAGTLLLQKDSTAGTTLFLGPTQLHLASGATTASAVRTYIANGEQVAERSTTVGTSAATLTWLGTDTQGTVNLQLADSTGIPTVRYQDPFGQARGTSSTTWSDGHGFLNATTDPLSGLVDLGARMYDASIGRFLSVDPVLSPSDPQQNNGYSYAHNTPITSSDPTGLLTGIQRICAIAANDCKAPTGGSTNSGSGEGQGPLAPGQALVQGVIHEGSEPLEWFYEQGGAPSAWLLANFDFTQDADGIIRTTADPWQLKHGYRNWFDTVFAWTTPNQPQTFEFPYGNKSYEIRAWVGDYPAIGDGGEIEYLSQNTQHPDMGGKWNADPNDANAPLLSESVTSGGSTIEASAPTPAQPWVNGWNPNDQLTDTALQFTATVTFTNDKMYAAFRSSVVGNPLWKFPQPNTATLSYSG